MVYSVFIRSDIPSGVYTIVTYRTRPQPPPCPTAIAKMSDSDSGYDPKYGYNRNDLCTQDRRHGQHGPRSEEKIIVSPVGRVSEAIHARRDKRRVSEAVEEDTSSPKTAVSKSGGQAKRKESAYVEVPPEVADSLVIGLLEDSFDSVASGDLITYSEFCEITEKQ